MRCHKCGAWSEVVETRKADEGLMLRRTRRCANGHRFRSCEIALEVFCSAKPRQRDFIKTARSRMDLFVRNRRILDQLKKGRKPIEVAEEFGVSTSSISLIKRKAEKETSHA